MEPHDEGLAAGGGGRERQADPGDLPPYEVEKL
jgi:hypothetical protein